MDKQLENVIKTIILRFRQNEVINYQTSIIEFSGSITEAMLKVHESVWIDPDYTRVKNLDKWSSGTYLVFTPKNTKVTQWNRYEREIYSDNYNQKRYVACSYYANFEMLMSFFGMSMRFTLLIDNKDIAEFVNLFNQIICLYFESYPK